MAVLLAIYFLIFNCASAINYTKSSSLGVLIENKLQVLFAEYTVDITKRLEKFNSERYQEIKPRFSSQIENSQARGKKMELLLLPLVFQLGAFSTWVLVTAALAAKSVAVGVILLVFKIAASSAKLASYFTAWKSHHQPWTPHHDHHSYHHDHHVHDTSPAVVSGGPWAPDYKSHDVTKLLSAAD